MKRILSAALAVIMLLTLSVTAFANDEIIRTEEDAIAAAKQEIEVWKEKGLLCPEVTIEGEPNAVAEIEPHTGDDYWYGREFSHAYEVRWFAGSIMDSEAREDPAYGCNVRIDAVTGKIISADFEAIATDEDEPDPERTMEMEMEKPDPADPAKTITETKTFYFYNNFDDIFPAEMTVDEFCTLLAEYWGFNGYTIADTVDEVEYHNTWEAIDGSILLKDLNADSTVNYYLTVFFDGDQEGAPIYVSLHQFPGYVMLHAGVNHAVG